MKNLKSCLLIIPLALFWATICFASTIPIYSESRTTSTCIIKAVNGSLKSKMTSASDQVVLKVSNYLPITMKPYLIDGQGNWEGFNYSYKNDELGDNDWQATAITQPNIVKDAGDDYQKGQSPQHQNMYLILDSLDVYVVFVDMILGGIVSVAYVPSDKGEAKKDPVASSCLTGSSNVGPLVSISDLSLAAPNKIGGAPQPRNRTPVPGDSIPVLVAAAYIGTYSIGKEGESGYSENAARVLTRHQYWSQTSDSFVLAPKEFRSTTVETFYGVETESSSMTNFAASLGMSASAGYGPISASVSATLSASTSSSQTVTIQHQERVTSERTFDNQTGADPLAIYYFQLTDVLTSSGWQNSAGKGMVPTSQLTLRQSPVVIKQLPQAKKK